MRGDKSSRPSSGRRAKPRARKLLVSGFNSAPSSDLETPADKRKKVVNLCKVLLDLASGQPVKITATKSTGEAKEDARVAALAPRVRQTLHRMLAGDSEKEIGTNLGVSKHTVHVYVKLLYHHFDVNSRGELLARFVEASYRKNA